MMPSAASFGLRRNQHRRTDLTVPTLAMTQGGEEVDEKITIAPANDLTGEYANVEDGELRVDFEP